MRRLIFLFLGFALLAGPKVHGARAGALGAELRAYPAGLISGLRGELSPGQTDLLFLHAGYNATDRRDWGEHTAESGGGGGVGLGWLHQLGSPARGWSLGARMDYWRLSIDWEDPDRSGQSKVDVLQPTVSGAYRWNRGHWRIETSLSLGREINLSTDGEDVGEGWILLVGVGAFFGI